MPRFTFIATNSIVYTGGGTAAGTSTEGYDVLRQGSFIFFGNMKSLIAFDADAIRTALADQVVTACYFDFHVQTTEFSSGLLVVGTHNHTTLPPTSYEPSRVRSDRLRKTVTERSYTLEFDLGTTIGNELKNGVTTGIALGPAPNDSYSYAVAIRSHEETPPPVLVIDTQEGNVAPYDPVVEEPAHAKVFNIYGEGLSFKWTHSDPNGDPQAGWYFRRTREGVNEWWSANDGGWATTPQLLTDNTVTKVNGLFTIPAGQWTNGFRDEWSIATQDPGGLVGPYSTRRAVYGSAPPGAQVTEPTASTTNELRPVIRWAYQDPEGDPQFGWIAMVVDEETYLEPGWTPDSGVYTWRTSGSSEATSVQPTVDLQNNATYRAYVQVSSSPNPSGGLQFSTWDYAEFTVTLAPYPPRIISPQNGSVTDLESGFVIDWENRFYAHGTQSSFAIRRLDAAGTYTWWDGGAWVVSEVFIAGSGSTYPFRPGEVLNGATYTFNVAIRDEFGRASPYSPDVTVEGSFAPEVSILSPVDTVVTANPFVNWSVYEINNNPQQTYQVRVFGRMAYESAGFDPGASTEAVFDTGEVVDAGIRGVQVTYDLVNTHTYRFYVRVQVNGVYSGWTYTEVEASFTPPGAPSGRAIVLQDEGAIRLELQGRNSMLSEDAGEATADWVPNTSNSTIIPGESYSSSTSGFITNISAEVSGVAIGARTSVSALAVENVEYTAAATLVSAVGTPGTTGRITLQFVNELDEIILEVEGDGVDDSSALRADVTVEAPAQTVGVHMIVTFGDPVNAGDIHGFFDPVVRPGGGTEWSPGGMLKSSLMFVAEVNQQRIVRQGLNVPIPLDSQLVVLIDEEVPIGIPQQYEVVVRAVATGTTLSSNPYVIPEVLWTSGWLWLSDPARTGSARSFAPQSLGVVTRPARQGKFRPIGRPEAVFTKGTRGLREGSFTIVTKTRDERETYLDLVTETDVVLLRVPPDQGELPGDTIYVRLEGDLPVSRPLPSRTPHRTIEQTWTEQLRPTTGLQHGEEVL